jgi:hypothetical protein
VRTERRGADTVTVFERPDASRVYTVTDESGRLLRRHRRVIADSINRAVAANPSEVFLVEGHTDAVGSEIDNLSLSDRRAESVALVLAQQFAVPAENLTTQGYGEQYLKIPTQGPERANRRVTMRRITPLLTGRNDAIPRAPQ